MESSPVFMRCPSLVQYMTLTCFCIKMFLWLVQPRKCKPRNSEFHWSYFSRNDIFLGMTTELRNKKLQKYCSSAQLMFANSPRNGKITIGVFFSHNSYSQCFFFHILSFFGVVAIFNSVFFRKFKDNLNYTISTLILNRCKTLYRKWQYARRHEVLTSFLM